MQKNYELSLRLIIAPNRYNFNVFGPFYALF